MEDTSSPVLAGDRHHPGLILATLCLASFMATLDLFVVNVALHDIGKDLASSQLSNLSWILNAYAIIFGALLVPAGRFADKVGTKTSSSSASRHSLPRASSARSHRASGRWSASAACKQRAQRSSLPRASAWC
jgi:MFS family permease